MNVLKHMRRAHAQIDGGNWSISCDCGWDGETSCMSGSRIKTGTEVEADLEKLFVDHLPKQERHLYVLVDQQLVEVPESDAKGAPLIMVPRGNFLMPIGTPITLLSHSKRDGVHLGIYRDPATGDVGELPIGEIRTADNRVFKLDSDA